MEFNNYVSLSGHATKNPEIRNAKNGVPFCAFTIANNEHYKDKESGDQKSSTQWVNVIAWGEFAKELENHLDKGTRVAVSGKLFSFKDTVGDTTIERVQVRVSKCRIWGDGCSVVFDEFDYLKSSKDAPNENYTDATQSV